MTPWDLHTEQKTFLTARVVGKLDSVLSLPNCNVSCLKMFCSLCVNSQLAVLSPNIEVTEK